MIIEIQHETRLEYSESVSESIAEVRMEPMSDRDQSCRSFHLAVGPNSELFRYQDGFHNRVHHFNLLPPHALVRVLAASVVETHPQPRELASCQAAWPIELDGAELGVLDFLRFRGPVRQGPRLAALAEQLRPVPGERLYALVERVSGHIQGHFTYAKAVTHASSPVDDVLDQKKGVCQDFAHLMIGLLRTYGVPTRYVSGYIHRPNKESQSHAWCEIWLPDLGWFGMDPTNNTPTNEHFVKVAIGRDFTDVPPNKGVFRGRAKEAIFVRVETRKLERLPSLSWQEELPPLNVPLMAVGSVERLEVDTETQQQQQ